MEDFTIILVTNNCHHFQSSPHTGRKCMYLGYVPSVCYQYADLPYMPSVCYQYADLPYVPSVCYQYVDLPYVPSVCYQYADLPYMPCPLCAISMQTYHTCPLCAISMQTYHTCHALCVLSVCRPTIHALCVLSVCRPTIHALCVLSVCRPTIRALCVLSVCRPTIHAVCVLSVCRPTIHAMPSVCYQYADLPYMPCVLLVCSIHASQTLASAVQVLSDSVSNLYKLIKYKKQPKKPHLTISGIQFPCTLVGELDRNRHTFGRWKMADGTPLLLTAHVQHSLKLILCMLCFVPTT